MEAGTRIWKRSRRDWARQKVKHTYSFKNILWAIWEYPPILNFLWLVSTSITSMSELIYLSYRGTEEINEICNCRITVQWYTLSGMGLICNLWKIPCFWVIPVLKLSHIIYNGILFTKQVHQAGLRVWFLDCKFLHKLTNLSHKIIHQQLPWAPLFWGRGASTSYISWTIGDQ